MHLHAPRRCSTHRYSTCLFIACLTMLLAWLPLLALAQTARELRYAGVNLAGAEFNSSSKPGTLYKDYLYPGESDYAYFASKGMNTVRLPFLWERLQPQANAALDATQLSYLHTAVNRAKARQMSVVLDVHNYAKYDGKRIGNDLPDAVFADLWRRLASEFKDDDAVIFGLMNEPNGVDAVAWARAAQAGLDAIRETGARNLVLVPGTAYTGAHSWNSIWYGGVSNAEALLAINDPADRIAFEVHQYLDNDYSGTSGQCQSEQIGVQKLQGFTQWLKQHGKRGFLGEFGAGTDATCMAALKAMLQHIDDNGDVWLGWTWWAAGAWWKPDYPFNVQPDKEGNDKPQMPTLSAAARRVTQ
ncbi:Cellulase family 5 [Pseudoxanthomonas wuyuanensis]|uniref:Endoglucanase n=2 Tax=Pseudoxanthomonas wuyuanensis TaxID=1073196 RepID=A0A286DFJ8_9GAMM|nr:Cellulase family 5 [Pseudoxanthomonas wuyuanensis]